MIEVKNVQKTYLLGAEGVSALRGKIFRTKFSKLLGVSLKVYKGEFLCILGTSGGGKTTLLNVMGTIDKPTKVMDNLAI
jgi:putative ABC transport system ATP-binding protein